MRIAFFMHSKNFQIKQTILPRNGGLNGPPLFIPCFLFRWNNLTSLIKVFPYIIVRAIRSLHDCILHFLGHPRLMQLPR